MVVTVKSKRLDRTENGCGKKGEKEPVDEVTIEMGDVVSIVGPTGSGKTMLINDIELFAHNDTPSERKILIYDLIPPEEFSLDPSKNPIALIKSPLGKGGFRGIFL